MNVFDDKNLTKVINDWVDTGVKDIISIGPDIEGAYLRIIKDGIETRVGAEVLAIGAHGLVKPEGDPMWSFSAPQRAWDAWVHSFRSYIADIKKDRPDVEMSWRWRPEMNECSCGKSSSVFARVCVYDKLGLDWAYNDGVLRPKTSMENK